MSAPTLGMNWQSALGEIKNDWAGRAITGDAIATLGSLAAVPCNNGGIQLQVHRDGLDIEICIEPDGRISSVFAGRPNA
jgi:hypothetical protein